MFKVWRLQMGGPYIYKNQKISGGVEAVLYNLKQGFNRYEPDINLKIIAGSKKVKSKIEIDNNIVYLKHPKIKFGSIYLSSYVLDVKNLLHRILRLNDYKTRNMIKIW